MPLQNTPAGERMLFAVNAIDEDGTSPERMEEFYSALVPFLEMYAKDSTGGRIITQRIRSAIAEFRSLQ